MSPKRLQLEIFLVSMAAVLLEISYTRVFSYKLHYYFTYLVIGISLLGIGSGGVFVAVFERLRSAAPERIVALCCAAGGLAVPLGYWIVATTQLNALDIAREPLEFLTLVGLCTLVFTPFFLVGICISVILGSRPDEIGRLYSADLVGAGLACALCVPLFAIVSPPGTIMLGGLVLALACLRPAGPGLLRGLSGLLAVGLAAAAWLPDRLPDPIPDRHKSMSPQFSWNAQHLFSRWSTVFRVDVIDPYAKDFVPEAGAKRYPLGFEPGSRYLISHDGNLGSNLLRFRGDWSELAGFETDVRKTPFGAVSPDPEVLIIGAAGGHEILASLYFGASHVTAVELNPVTASLLTDHFADYTGRIAEDPRVDLVNAEGRSFIKRDRGRYDLIWFVAPDSYAAMNAASSGAFVLSESYLYTEEMIIEAMGHLKEGGLICLQTGDIDFGRKPNRATRYLSTARSAFAQLGIHDFDQHVMVASVPEFFTMVTILLSREPMSPERIARFRRQAATIRPKGNETTVWHPRSLGRMPRHPVQMMIALSDPALEAWKKRYPYDLSPVTDNAPFFWHFTSFYDALFEPHYDPTAIFDPEDSVGERVLVALLLFVVVFSAAFLLLPLLAVREIFGQLPHKARASLYFACLGLGFMFFEICLIQKLTLFLGYPTYSLTVTLFALLVSSGIGSLLSQRWAQRADTALRNLLAVLAVLTLGYQYGLDAASDALVGIPLAARVLLAVAFLAPLGLCLGAFMPLGLRRVSALSEHRMAVVAWAWAINGFFSVMASVLATMLSMSFGFRVVLFLALALYGLAVLALYRLPALSPGAEAA